ncbi:FAD-binding oxidoreductase [Streptomyces sp. RB6PN25]|uniref:FAD-binding oxidoreductase n=1 Tax=Streptomyces humicola TaxID=2953240 RepID=A0ABT1Q2V2_9ACTN|nr:FAD-dependent oxidoreductase [Streptomyces humicola]MCQ4084251.1 FAD-binding oxidoreductase [Streptomyces humicola]
MRICITGAGIAGMLIAWRLVRQAGVHVTLITGPDAEHDATAFSGGLVRGFDTDPRLSELAARSLAELRESALLRDWSEYREVGSVHVVGSSPAGERLAVLDRMLPGSASLLQPAELAAQFGMEGLPEQAVGVLELHAGYFSPDALRRAARRDFTARGGEVYEGAIRELGPDADGFVYRTSTEYGHADAIVFATGAWTGRLLSDLGFPDTQTGLRTKAIQCAVYEVEGERPPAFVDETSGLYGRPAGPGRMLFGLPTDRWDLPPGPQVFLDREEREVRVAVARRFPGLTVHRRPRRVIASAEAYAAEGRLALRPVLEHRTGLFTYAGGSGAAAKTALAASADAAADLMHTLRARRPLPTAERDHR